MSDQITTLQDDVTKKGGASGTVSRADGLTTAGGLIAAFGSVGCCIVPLVLFALGAGGSWVANLTALSPYQPYFVAAAIGFIAVGFWRVYRPAARSCEADGACASPLSRRIAKAGLWTAVVLVAAALAFNWLAPRLLQG